MAYRIVFIALGVFAYAWTSLSAPATLAPPKTQAVWVYPNTTSANTITDPAARQRFFTSAAASRINMIYVSVYRSTPNSNGRQLYDEGTLANFIGAAHAAGMQVYAEYGTPDWYSSGCGTAASPSFAAKRLLEIAAYNATNPRAVIAPEGGPASWYVGAMFDGVILDIEPSRPVNYPALLAFYQCAQGIAVQNHYGLAAAVSAFWDDLATFNGATKEAYKHIVDLRLNNVVVMGYRNYAGTRFCSQGDGIICLDQDIVTYANHNTMVLVGLETTNPATAGLLDKESFFVKGQDSLNHEAQAVHDYFASSRLNFGGYAIDSYQDAYLVGAGAWSSANPAFPTGSPRPISPR